MSDERPNSLAAQAASWVPPWERAQRPPDPDYAAAAPEPDIADDIDEPDDADQDSADVRADSGATAVSPAAPVARTGTDPDDDEDDDDDLAADDDADDEDDDYGTIGDVPAELAPLPGEAGGEFTVDAPQELPGEEPLEPTEVGGGPEVPLPPSISDAVEEADADFPGSPVDAPLPPDGDDAGDVFDVAADDEVDDAEIDLPFAEEVPEAPAEDVPAADDAEDIATGGDEVAGVDDATAVAGAVAEGAGAGRAGAAIPAQGRGGGEPAAAVDGGRPRTPEEAGPPPEMDEAEMRAALESILLVVDEPVAEMQLAQILEQPTERVAAMLEDISARYTAAGHGFDLRRAAGGWRLYTRPEYAAYVERFVLDGQSVRLTQAALETLAVVAYKQPVTRSRISAIRGVNCDGVMRTLVTRGLIEECGTESETGAHLYRTTALFLEKLGLNSVDQLPPLAPFLPDDVEEVLDASG